MKKPVCTDIQKKMAAYLEGDLDPDEAREIEEHLAYCEECGSILNKEENNLFINSPKSDTENIRRIQRRFLRRVILWAVGIIVLLAAVYHFLLGPVLVNAVTRANSEKFRDLDYALKDLVVFTIPGASLKGGNVGNVSNYVMTNNIEFELNLVGGGYQTGVVRLETPVFKNKNTWQVKSENVKRGSSFVFYYPQHRSSSIYKIFDKFARYGDGTKSEIAIYFETPVSCKEMSALLKQTDCASDRTWFAVDTGDTVEKDNDFKKPYRELAMHAPQWGFPMNLPLTPTTADHVTMDDNGNITSMSGGFSAFDVAYVSEKFIKEMEQLQDYAEKYFNAPEFTEDLAKINKYISTNGIKITGVILEASNTDLVKLRENENIARIDIVKVDFDY